MLAQWLPAISRIDELLAADVAAKTVPGSATGLGSVRVSYPCTVNLTRGAEQIERAGRTLEVAFAFDNLEWTQEYDNRDLKLCIRAPKNLEDLALRLHKKVHGSNYKKTDFALALLAKDPDGWAVPVYIAEGLRWLEDTLGVAEQQDKEPEGAVE